MAKRYNLPVQSHLSENKGEVAWVRELEPEVDFYGQAYEKYGLFGGDVQTIMAHCVLRTSEERMLMAKNGVEGVYTADPREDPDAEFISELTHRQAIEQRLGVMDSTALSLCMDNSLPIYVFNMDDERNIDRIVCGERVGTVVSSG